VPIRALNKKFAKVCYTKMMKI